MFYDLGTRVPICFAIQLLLDFVSAALSEGMDDIYQIGLVRKPPCELNNLCFNNNRFFGAALTSVTRIQGPQMASATVCSMAVFLLLLMFCLLLFQLFVGILTESVCDFYNVIRGSNILLRILTFAKPERDNVLQSEQRSGEGCNTLSHEGLENVNIRKRMLYRHCYIPFFQAVQNNFIQLYAKNFHRNIMKLTTNSHRIGGNQKRQYYRRT